MNPFLRIITSLNSNHIRYVVVGGFAAILHGVPRVTGDLDLIIDLDPAEAKRTIDVLLKLGLNSPLPVDPADFAKPESRAAWINQKGMTVFTLYDSNPGGPTVNLFVHSPIPFAQVMARSRELQLQGQPIRVCSIEDLINLKQQSARPIDLEDIRGLRAIQSSKPRSDNT